MNVIDNHQELMNALPTQLLYDIAILFGYFNGISTFVGYLMPKSPFLKNSNGTILTYKCEDMEVHAFPKGIYPKVNVIAAIGVRTH